jgi:hypothetical protein
MFVAPDDRFQVQVSADMLRAVNVTNAPRSGAERNMSVTTSTKRACIVLALVIVGAIVAAFAGRPLGPPTPKPAPAIASHPAPDVAEEPAPKSALESVPPDVREFLGRVLEKVPEPGTAVTGYEFWHWEQSGKPTREAIGLKAIASADPHQLIAQVMNVDGYQGNLAHVDISRSEKDPAFEPPRKVRFFQLLSVPGIAKIQHELALVDMGTIKGYRVACWYLLRDRTESLSAKLGARSDYNVGAWLAAPGVVGYALSSWPKRADVNALQWMSLTSGANTMAKKIIEDNIDGMAAWARKEIAPGQPSPAH